MNEITKLLIQEIKEKNQIKNIEDSFINKILNQYFLKNGDIRKKIEKEFKKEKRKITKSKNFRLIIKEVRNKIGQIYGQFLTQKFKKKEKILLNLNIDELLLIHKSSRERSKFYEEIYSKIFNWYKPKIILDLCCGMNPLSYNLMKIKPKYIAIDLNPKDMIFLNSFFKTYNIDGIAFSSDISSLNILNINHVKTADLVFLFKSLDSLEKIKKNISKELLEKLPQKRIVVSFPTKSLISKKNINKQERNWFLNFLEKKKWKFETFEIENEIFFLIEKTTNL